MRVDHYGIVVRNIREHYEQNMAHLLGETQLGPIIDDPLQQCRVAFVRLEGGALELVEPSGEDSPVSAFLKKRPAGYHHVCIEVDDLNAMLSRCRDAGQVIVSDPTPAVAFDGRRIAFVMGQDRLLWELLESR